MISGINMGEIGKTRERSRRCQQFLDDLVTISSAKSEDTAQQATKLVNSLKVGQKYLLNVLLGGQSFNLICQELTKYHHRLHSFVNKVSSLLQFQLGFICP